MRLLVPLGIALVLIGLWLAFFAHSIIWYSVFLIGGFLLFEGLNKPRGFSVLAHPKKFLYVWCAFILITIVIELIGNHWYNLWDSPFGVHGYFLHAILIGYPFTGFFGLTLFVFAERFLHSRNQQYIGFPIIALLFGYINEYPNTFAHAWTYINWPPDELTGIPILVLLLWIIILIVLPFRRFFREEKL